jgi:hypothetical protein
VPALVDGTEDSVTAPPVEVDVSSPATITDSPFATPYPPLKDAAPQLDALECPAATDTSSCAPVSPVPNVTVIAPPLTLVAAPVLIWIDPLSPLVLAPVAKVSMPDTQLVPALAVVTVVDPELVAVAIPVPDDRVTAAPALVVVDVPAVVLAL